MPILWFLAGDRVFGDLLNLLSVCNFIQIVKEECLNACLDRILLVGADSSTPTLVAAVLHHSITASAFPCPLSDD